MGNGNKVEFLVAVCALITSVVAIWVAWDQSRVMRAQQHGMVYPVLQADGFMSTNATTRSLGIRLQNSGVGPALIEQVTVKDDGDIISSLEPYRTVLPDGYDTSWTRLSGRALAPGEGVEALHIRWSRDDISDEAYAAAAAAWSEIDFEFCYCSVFGRCWIASMWTSRASRTEQCSIQDADVFEAFGTAPRPTSTTDDPTPTEQTDTN